MMDDRGDRAADVGKQLADALLARRQSPLGEVDLRIVGEQVQDAAAGRCDTTIVERLQVLKRDRLALLIGHRLRGQCHRPTLTKLMWYPHYQGPAAAARARTGGRTRRQPR